MIFLLADPSPSLTERGSAGFLRVQTPSDSDSLDKTVVSGLRKIDHKPAVDMESSKVQFK